MRKVPRFCCHLRGEADTAQLCAGGDQVRAVIGSSWFCAACGSRLSGRQLPFPRAVETMSATSKEQNTHNRRLSRAAFESQPRRRLSALLVELGGIEPPSSTRPLQPTGSVSAATRPSHCGPTKAHPCSPSSCARFLMNRSVVTADPLTLCRFVCGMGVL